MAPFFPLRVNSIYQNRPTKTLGYGYMEHSLNRFKAGKSAASDTAGRYSLSLFVMECRYKMPSNRREIKPKFFWLCHVFRIFCYYSHYTSFSLLAFVEKSAGHDVTWLWAVLGVIGVVLLSVGTVAAVKNKGMSLSVSGFEIFKNCKRLPCI